MCMLPSLWSIVVQIVPKREPWFSGFGTILLRWGVVNTRWLLFNICLFFNWIVVWEDWKYIKRYRQARPKIFVNSVDYSSKNIHTQQIGSFLNPESTHCRKVLGRAASSCRVFGLKVFLVLVPSLSFVSFSHTLSRLRRHANTFDWQDLL